MTANICSIGTMWKSFLVLLVWKEVTACLFQQRVRKQDKQVDEATVPWEKDYGRSVSDKCDCGLDQTVHFDDDPDENLKKNNIHKSWHLYIHVKRGPDLVKHFVRTCTGTVINSKMMLASHNCLKVRNYSIPIYQAWTPQPRHMADGPLPTVENLVITKIADISQVDVKYTFRAMDIIYNAKFMYSDAYHYPNVESDVVIIVFEFTWPMDQFPPICVPEISSKLDPTGYRAYYYGVGGELDADPTPEQKFVGDLLVMPGKLCDVDNGNESLCVQYRLDPPTISGGPLVMPSNGLLNKRGFTPGQTVFLIGLSSHAIKARPGTTITSTIFTSIPYLAKYLEYYGKKVGAQWCKTPELGLFGKRQDPKKGLVQLYPWEDKKSFPKANYLDRDETLNCACGLHNLETELGTKAGARIVGGVDAKQHEFPWITYYSGVWLNADKKTILSLSCGSSIINDRVILTAAHCVVNGRMLGRFPDQESVPNNTNIYYGVYNLNQENGLEVEAEVLKTIFFPDYTLSTRQEGSVDGDLALVILKEPIQFAKGRRHGQAKPGDVRPICLPKRDKPFPVEGQKATLIGWGKMPKRPDDTAHPSQWSPAEKLQKLENILIHPLTDCSMRTHFSMRDSVICAGSWNRTHDASGGDSGAPLTVRSKNGFWVQVGIVSFAEYSFDTSSPDITDARYQGAMTLYTNVQKYLDFIDYISKKEGAKWCVNSI